MTQIQTTGGFPKVTGPLIARNADIPVTAFAIFGINALVVFPIMILITLEMRTRTCSCGAKSDEVATGIDLEAFMNL